MVFSHHSFVSAHHCCNKCACSSTSTLPSWKLAYLLFSLFRYMLFEFSNIWSYCGKIYWHLLPEKLQFMWCIFFILCNL